MVRGSSLVERLAVLRDELLDTVEHGDADPPGAEIFDAMLASLSTGQDSVTAIDLSLRDAIARRLAWGDPEDVLLGHAERVVAKLQTVLERSFPNPEEQLTIAEAMSAAWTTLARVVALAAVDRAGRERTLRLREELTHRQLREAVERQEETIVRLEERAGSEVTRF